MELPKGASGAKILINAVIKLLPDLAFLVNTKPTCWYTLFVFITVS